MHCALFYKQKEQLNMRNVNVHFKMCIGTTYTTVGLLWYCEIGRQYLLFFTFLELK